MRLPLIEFEVVRGFQPDSGGAANQVAPPALRGKHGAPDQLAVAQILERGARLLELAEA